MGVERRSHVLLKEAGVLPGSESYITTDVQSDPQALQYLQLCGHYHCTEGYQIDRLYFDGLLLAYIQDGCLRVEYDGQTHVAEKETLVLLDLRKPHVYRADGSLEFSWMHLSGNACEQLYRMIYDRHGAIIRSAQNRKIYEKMHFILSSFHTEQYLSLYDLSALVYEIMVSVLAVGHKPSQASPNRLVTATIEYMKYNLGNRVNLEDIAQTAHLSKYYFSRLFKEHTGYTPYAYLQKLRMDTAKHLLANTGSTVKEIAFSVGYQSEMGFILAFTEKVGVTPGRYRQYPI